MRLITAVLAFGLVVGLIDQAWPATYYADNLVACTGNYNISTRACNGSDGNSYTTIAAGVAPLVAGDTLRIRPFSGGSGAWNERIDLQAGNKTGQNGLPITIGGLSGERPKFAYVNAAEGSYGTTRARGTRGYIIFENMEWDGSGFGNKTQGISIRDGNHHFTLNNLWIHDQPGTAVGVWGIGNAIRNCKIYNAVTINDVAGERHYGIYIRGTTDVVVEYNQIYDNDGGGIQHYDDTGATTSNAIIRYNVIRNNNRLASAQNEGVTIQAGPLNQLITGMQIYGNLIYGNGFNVHGIDQPSSSNAGGISLLTSAGSSIVGTLIHNNTIYGNHGNGVEVGSAAISGTDIRNNIITANTGTEYVNAGTGTTISHSACTSSESCGSTGKVTLTAITDATISPSDFRLKQGTNPARDAGTAVSTRPAPVGTTDIGAFEQGMLASAVVVGTVIEATANIMTPDLRPSTAISGLTITCITCTGSPVATGILKPGATSVMQVSISGLTGSGTCSLNLGSTNATDSGYVGGPLLGSAQGLNSVTGLAVVGTCVNASGGGGGGSGLYSRLLLEEGSGTTANDDSGLAHHGTVSSGVTWVTGGVTIPTDATFRHIDTGYGSGVNPTTQSFTQCAYVVVDLGVVPSVVGGSVIDIDRRAYYGVQTVGGQPQWGIGVQGSGFSTGSEFVATGNPTLVCLLFDASTDTATLRVDNVNGSISGKSVKTYTSYTLASHLRVGNDGTFTTNNGGFTVYGIWTWDTLASDSDLTALYELLSPSGTPNPCYKQDAHKWQLVFTDGANPIWVGLTDAAISVVDGGGVALNIQIICTGSAGTPVAFRFFYTTDGVTYLEIPSVLGAGGIAMWGGDQTSGLNAGSTTGRISGSLTPTPGITLISSNVSPTVTLAQDSAYEIRLLLRLAPGLVGQFRSILAKQDNGLDLANAPTIGPARIDIVNPRGGGMF